MTKPTTRTLNYGTELSNDRGDKFIVAVDDIIQERARHTIHGCPKAQSSADIGTVAKVMVSNFNYREHNKIN